jgi:peptidoglycan/xylan/chitin deacetylase (PgdA/CDA1 family)
MKGRGIFTISIDLELAWGICDKPISAKTSNALMREREIIRRLLNLFSRYTIQATWAIVGHLMLVKCDWDQERVHPEFRRPIIKDHTRDWFFQHPKNQTDPLWYGRDIVEWIRSAEPPQEIGSHSFCHVPYDQVTTRPETVRQDIEKARESHRSLELPFEIFIFPRNRLGHRELLAQAGVLAYRGNTRRWYYSIRWNSIRRLFNFLYFLLPIPPRTVTATVDETGMVNIPDSMQFFSRQGSRSLVSSKSLTRKGVVGLNRAVERGEVFHLWFHPSNFAYGTNRQFESLENILKHAQLLRTSGQLEVLTMGEIQRRITAPDRWISTNVNATEISFKRVMRQTREQTHAVTKTHVSR